MEKITADENKRYQKHVSTSVTDTSEGPDVLSVFEEVEPKPNNAQFQEEGEDIEKNLSEEEAMTATILSALEKATLFLKDSYNEINVDGMVGYRMLQEYLNAVLEKWESRPGLQSSRERVVHLEEKLSALLDQTGRALEQNMPAYYRDQHGYLHEYSKEEDTFAPALAPGFWKIPHQWNQTDPSLAPPLTNSSGCLNGSISDSCISHLLGTRGDDAEPCFVPSYCPDIMTIFGCSDYSLTHQLFYFMFADMKECSNPLFLDAPYYKNVFCASMKETNVDAEKQGYLDTIGDLFVENILFCGMVGFSDFYQPRWLKIILNWQKPGKGCFWMYGDQFQAFNKTSGEYMQGVNRVKRAEKILKDNCSSHNTAVAVAALGGFLHYGV